MLPVTHPMSGEVVLEVRSSDSVLMSSQRLAQDWPELPETREGVLASHRGEQEPSKRDEGPSLKLPLATTWGDTHQRFRNIKIQNVKGSHHSSIVF